jgi:hypothetical protein
MSPSGCLQLFHDFGYAENVDSTSEIAGEHMQAHLGLNVR